MLSHRSDGINLSLGILLSYDPLQVVFGRTGDGHTAARHFVRQHLAQLRYHNPDAEIIQRNSKVEKQAYVDLQLASNEPLRLDVTGLPHRLDVLRKVLEAAQVSSESLDASISAAAAMNEVTIDPSGYCGDHPAKTHGVLPRVVQSRRA